MGRAVVVAVVCVGWLVPLGGCGEDCDCSGPVPLTPLVGELISLDDEGNSVIRTDRAGDFDVRIWGRADLLDVGERYSVVASDHGEPGLEAYLDYGSSCCGGGGTTITYDDGSSINTWIAWPDWQRWGLIIGATGLGAAVLWQVGSWVARRRGI